MILLTKGNSDVLTLTLSEKVTLSNPYYLFVFRNQSSNEYVRFIKNSASDESAYPERSNQFTITTNTHFLNATNGFWTYKVYEQASAVNTDETGLTLIEQGIMKLVGSSEETVTYEGETQTFIVYNGS